jgi:rhodanese-related sulfurtransferase
MNANFELVRDPKTTIIDVRSEGEFMMGHVEGSINIPLDTVPDRVEEFKTMEKPIVFCCASGNRSGQATRFLLAQGVTDIYNGGGWGDVKLMRM